MISNVEFFLEGGRAGILLIHGLTGTPKEMRFLGRGLHRAGFTVYGMQLEGHCGDEQDLLATGWQDWYRSVQVAADRLRKQVDHFFIGGLSMGAVLALRYAADFPERVSGVGVYGPTFRYDGWSIPFYARHLYVLLRLVKKLNLLQDRRFNEHAPYGLKDERLRAVVAASMQSGNSADAGLAGNPYPSLADMLTLAAGVRRDLDKVISPCLIMHALNDDIADISNSRLVERKVSGPTRMVVLENSYHMITIDLEHREVIRQSVDYFRQQIENRLRAAGDFSTVDEVLGRTPEAVTGA